MPRLWPRFIRLPALLVMTLALSGPAGAHAVLVGSDPVDGAVLAVAPEAIRLEFTEPVRPLSLRLIAPDGRAVELADAAEAGPVLRIPVTTTDTGTQVFSWRVVSDDGHPVSGALIFGIGTLTGEAVPRPAHDPVVQALLWLARLALTAGLMTGAGIGLVAAATRQRLGGRLRSVTRGATALGLTGLLLAPGLNGLDASGSGIGELLTEAAWIEGWRLSRMTLPLFAGLSCFSALLAMRWPVAGWLAVPALALGFAYSGHARSAGPSGIAPSLIALHIAGAAFWLGSLVALQLGLRHPAGRVALAVFSRLAPLAVGGLILGGTGLMILQLGTDPRHWLSAYGMILGLKLVLVLPLLAIALSNRLHLTVPAIAGEAGATARLRRAITAEIILILVILGLAAGWRFTPPPRALSAADATAASAPLSFILADNTILADIRVTPARPGPIRIEAVIRDATGQPVAPVSVSLALSHEGFGIAEVTRPLQPDAAGGWVIDRLIMPHAGDWRIALEIRLTSFTQTRLDGILTIR